MSEIVQPDVIQSRPRLDVLPDVVEAAAAKTPLTEVLWSVHALVLEVSFAPIAQSLTLRAGNRRAGTCGFGAVSAHVCVVEIGALQRETSLCPVQLEFSRFLASAVQMVGSSSFAWLSFPEPLAELGDCPLSVGSMVVVRRVGCAPIGAISY